MVVITQKSFQELGISAGDEAFITFKATAINITSNS
jgi:molybdopterin-binding protein